MSWFLCYRDIRYEIIKVRFFETEKSALIFEKMP